MMQSRLFPSQSWKKLWNCSLSMSFQHPFFFFFLEEISFFPPLGIQAHLLKEYMDKWSLDKCTLCLGRINRVSTNTNHLLWCTLALTCHCTCNCYDNSKHEWKMSSPWKQLLRFNVSVMKAHVPQAALSENLLHSIPSLHGQPGPNICKTLTFFNDCLICHDNTVVIYMLEKREAAIRQIV